LLQCYKKGTIKNIKAEGSTLNEKMRLASRKAVPPNWEEELLQMKQ
jgi:hypothetical protein